MSADLAVEVTDAAFLVDLDDYCILVVAEEAGECGRKSFALSSEWLAGALKLLVARGSPFWAQLACWTFPCACPILSSAFEDVSWDRKR